MKIPQLTLILACGVVCGLAEDKPGRPELEPPFTWVDPDDPSAAAIRQTGEQYINRVGSMLVSEVERSLAKVGLAETLEIVHLKNLVLPKALPGQPRVTAVKRTSLGLRNPANLPDAYDHAVLDRINTALKEGDDVPSLLMQHLQPAGGPEEWRVYRPITTMPSCVKCHGPAEELAPEVRAFLAHYYPQDGATGFSARQWRGVIRISLAAPEPAAPPKAK